MDPIWFDVAVGVVLLYAVIRGAKKGLVWQLAWIAAIVIGFAFSEMVSLHVAPLLEIEPPMDRWVAMFGLYMLATIVSFGVAFGLKDSIEKWKMDSVDRKLGAVFGLVKGAAACLVAIFFLVTLSKQARELALGSYSGYTAAVVMEKLHDYMPSELHDVLHPHIHKLDDAKDGGLRHHVEETMPGGRQQTPHSNPGRKSPFDDRAAGRFANPR